MISEETIQKLIEEGWIYDENSLWEDLDCFETYKTHLYNCDKCPAETECFANFVVCNKK